MHRPARLLSVALAAFAWGAVGAIVLDAAGIDLAGASAQTGTPVAFATSPDPCALLEPLPTGSDARCDLRLQPRAGTQPLVVTLDQGWEGNVLVQRFAVRDPSTSAPLYGMATRTAGQRISRISRLRAFSPAPGEEHLVLLVGTCGGLVCGSADLVVLGAPGGELRELLRVRLGRLAGFEIRDDGIVFLEGSFAQGAQQPDGIVARTYRWDRNDYVMRDVSLRPAPTPTPSPSPR